MEIKQNILNIKDLKYRLSIRNPVYRKHTHYPIPILVSIVLAYMFEVKIDLRKSLNKLSFAADSLKIFLYCKFI